MGISAYITNLGKYNEGELIGQWVKFPITAERLADVFREIGIGEQYEEFFITDYEVSPYIPGINSIFGEYADLDELNYLAAKLESMTEWQQSVFCGALSLDYDGLPYMINLTENLDSFIVIPNVKNEHELGEYLFEQEREVFSGMVEQLAKSYSPADKALARYIEKLESGYDAEGQGRDLTFSVTGIFCDAGYIYMDGDVNTIYEGKNDIPDEYVIT